MIEIGNCKWVSPILHESIINKAICIEERDDMIYWNMVYVNNVYESKINALFSINFFTIIRQHNMLRFRPNREDITRMGDLQRL